MLKKEPDQSANNLTVPASAWPGSTGKAIAESLKGQGAAGRFLFWFFFLFRQKKKEHPLTIIQHTFQS
ncbi:hypothetical protein [Mucilaginibacter limnophilus]|uniref:hypothetical protein n=1 Tax=Mucilaginibacter limnophilus TaxID=1932778 RepID=UPI000FD707F1|nr:hypothetical protein [Mucilaginibacter limnophilus]